MELKATIPNQINQETATPTLRWVFQCFDGINLIQQGDDYLYEKLQLDGFNDDRCRPSSGEFIFVYDQLHLLTIGIGDLA